MIAYVQNVTSQTYKDVCCC